MRSEMQIAYGLISDFKRGAIEPGSPITADQDRLIRLLAVDLQVNQPGAPIHQLVSSAASADTVWNKRTREMVIRFYDLKDAGQLDEAEREREAFLGECPSVWYCGIVSDL